MNFMNFISKIVSRPVLIVSLVMLAAATAAPEAGADPVAALKDIQGEVYIQPAGSPPDTWNPVTNETPVNYGDSVKTGAAGFCALVYGEEANIRLQPNTTITIGEESDTQDILLKLGEVKTKIDAEKARKPFQFVTPVAVSAVRGTEVGFSFNEAGQLVVELEDGSVYVFNDTEDMELTLLGNKKIKILYDSDTGALTLENDPSSDGPVEFSIGGETYTVAPGESTTVDTDTAGGGEGGPPDTGGGEPGGGETTPDEGPEDEPTPTTIPEEVSPVD